MYEARAVSRYQIVIAFAVPLLIILSMILLTKSSWFQLYPEELSLGITLDLVLTAPLAYILLSRKRKIPKTIAVPFFIVGMIVAGYIIPKDQQFYLTLIKDWVFPLVEMIVFVAVVLKVRKAIKLYKIQRGQTLDFYTALRKASGEMLPKKASDVFATEVAMIYYGFFSWKKRKLDRNEFSYHKETGALAILSVLIFLILAETFVVHLLLVQWSALVAWILSFASFYSALQIFGMARSMSKRPISIENGRLELRYGIFGESTISLDNIDVIELSSKSVDLNDQTCRLSPLGDIEGHNVVINLKSEHTMTSLWGLKKTTYKTILLFINEKERFLKEVNRAVQGI